MTENNITEKEINYCWNTIGTGNCGNHSCFRLKDFIHCRNCDEFKSKASLLLKMTAPQEYLQEWSALLSSEKKDENTDEKWENVFIFRLESEWLAFPLMDMKEVSHLSKIHKIPRKSDDTLLGLANIKGSLQLCFSLKTFLGIENAATKEEDESRNLFGARFAILEKSGFLWVFPVDEVLDIYRYNPEQALNTPLTVSNTCASYIKTVFRFQDKLVGYLDDELIISALKRKIS
ncbi:MAG: hypothetical protein A2017_17410 [Lentisphaerae bacterium GWF2_44_16]|nr:MAG: hypothetical protein A2017_17410 [Lentisphaerae bacterium GWF2_44_16]